MKFDITGQCPFGDKCHFAHGQAGMLYVEHVSLLMRPYIIVS